MATARKQSKRERTIIIYEWRGVLLARSMPGKNSVPPTESQLAYRKKFALVAAFLAPLRHIIIDSWAGEYGRHRLNKASAYHIKNAVTGDYPDLGIDYVKVKITCGNTIGTNMLSFRIVENTLSVAWTNTNGFKTQSSDKLLLVLYNQTLNKFIILQNVAVRSAGAFSTGLPSEWKGSLVHGWAAFSSGDCFTESEYCGSAVGVAAEADVAAIRVSVRGNFSIQPGFLYDSKSSRRSIYSRWRLRLEARSFARGPTCKTSTLRQR